jgi:hypothetical protein
MRSRNVLAIAVLASFVALAAPTAGAQETYTTAELLKNGLDAYDRLPGSPKLRDAPVFSEALGFLYAYEQRTLREGKRMNDGVGSALGWLVQSMEAMKTGKADGAPSDAALRDRGMVMYAKAKDSQQNDKIWDVHAYLSASANLFTYLQVAKDPEDKARSAHQWLVDAQSRLVVAGVGSADRPGPDPESWIPRKRRPDVSGARAGARAGVVIRGGAAARAGMVATPVVVSGGQPSAAGEPAKPDSSSSAKPAREDGDKAWVQRATELYLTGRLREARDLARGRLDANPGDVDAHTVLFQTYARAARAAATPEDRAVFWSVVDHLTIVVKSRGIGYDLGVRMLADYEARTPTAADLEARGWVAGQRLRINFAPYEWIDDETTVRPPRK